MGKTITLNARQYRYDKRCNKKIVYDLKNKISVANFKYNNNLNTYKKLCIKFDNTMNAYNCLYQNYHLLYNKHQETVKELENVSNKLNELQEYVNLKDYENSTNSAYPEEEACETPVKNSEDSSNKMSCECF